MGTGVCILKWTATNSQRKLTMDTRKAMKIKEWFYRKTCAVAKTYNYFIDVTDNSRDETGTITADENGFVEVIATITAESEKAIKARLETGAVVGYCKGWETWIPKSVIA